MTLEAHDLAKGFEKNISTIKGYWSLYKNASHLWASLMLTIQSTGGLPVDFKTVVILADKLASEADEVVKDWAPWRAPASLIHNQMTATEVEAPTPAQIEAWQSYRVGKK